MEQEQIMESVEKMREDGTLPAYLDSISKMKKLQAQNLEELIEKGEMAFLFNLYHVVGATKALIDEDVSQEEKSAYDLSAIHENYELLASRLENLQKS